MTDPPRKPSPAELRRRAEELHERASLPDMPAQQGIPYKPSPPLAYPGLRLGLGKQPIPRPKETPMPGAVRPYRRVQPTESPLPVKSSPEATIVTTVPPPAKGSAPTPPAHLDTLKGIGPNRTPLPPGRSLSPPPESMAARVKVGDVDFRVSKGTWARLRPYALWVALPLAGLVVGYYQGLRGAAERMRANEARVAAIAGELAELRAIHDQKLKGLSAGVGRAHVLADDHEARLDRLEPKVELHGSRLNALADQKAIIVKP